MSEFDPDDILSGLTPVQREAAVADGPVLALAGAGTGKTKTLTSSVAYRIAVRGVKPWRVLAVTFTNKAAGEMKGRIRRMLGDENAPGWVGTFHALSVRMLRANPEIAGLRAGFDVLDADDSLRVLKRVMKGMQIDIGSGQASRQGDSPLKQAEKHISRFKDNLVPPDEAARYVEERVAKAREGRLPLDADALRMAARVYVEYQRHLREANAADFGDLLLWTALALVRDDNYRRAWAERFDCVYADEYQDVNYAQYIWLRQFASEHGQIFIVGDDDQAIFCWRGSNVAFIRRFEKDFPGARVFRLEQNFRSTSHILDVANAIIARDKNRLGKRLFTELGEGDKVEVVRFMDAETEARGVVQEMQARRREGVAWGDMAVLYRFNAASRLFEEALRTARVPYVLVGDISFWQREEVKDSLALIRLVESGHDRQSDEALRRVVNVPARGIGAKALEAIEAAARANGTSLFDALPVAPLPKKAGEGARAFHAAVTSVMETPGLTLADAMSLAVDATGYREMLRASKAEDAKGRLENIQELVASAQRFDNAAALLEFAALGNAGEAKDESTDGAVQMMSFHRAKGLEFPHVFLPGWEDGIFPSERGDLAEERRLAYVALTRAMRRASVSFAGFRRGAMSPSRFLEEMPAENSVAGWLRDPPKARRANNWGIDPADLEFGRFYDD
jgi:DNA helicase-2/ATP-dependent DNA helicase PcrA